MATHISTSDSLERSLRSFSIHDSDRCFGSKPPATTTIPSQKSVTKASGQDRINLDLNSETSLPYMWEQCLDLKNGEIHFINRRNGVKTKEDPREMDEYRGQYYYSDEEEDEEDENEEESCDYGMDGEGCRSNVFGWDDAEGEKNVLVAAGCRSCLMYYMVPKQVNDCPKCNQKLLRFDQLENSSSSLSVI